MFDSTFDPYQTLLNLDANLQTLIQAHNLLARRVEEQGHTIDILLEGLTKSNLANEALMRDMAHNINTTIKELK